MARWDINRILQSVDVDDSGNVSYTEFLAACYSWQETELNVVWTAFQKIDKVGSHRVRSGHACSGIDRRTDITSVRISSLTAVS